MSSTTTEAAAMLRRLLEAVERGDLEAGGGQGVALMGQIEGAVAALEGAPGPDAGEVAATMRRLVDAVDRGELGGTGRQAAMLRRMEGAALALEAVVGAGPGPGGA